MAGEAAGSRLESLGERMSGAFLGAQELLTVHLGLELGLYQALAEMGTATAAEVAAAAGCDERYVREWLEQLAVAGIASVPDGGADGGFDAEERRYLLPATSRRVLLDGDDLDHLGPLAPLLAALARALAPVATAFRSGAGVAAGNYGDDLRRATAALNKPLFTHLLVQRWLPSLPAVDARLRTGPPARVADFGCGAGWAAIAVALAYPLVTVDGVDADEAGIADARRHAAEADVAERVSFVVADAAGPGLDGPYDLVMCLEALHDMGRPVDALSAMRSLLAGDGTLLLAEERVAEAFVAPGNARDRAAYCWSVLHCLPVARAVPGSTATGAVLRPSLMARLAAQAGFGSVRAAAIDDRYFRFYILER